MSALDAALAKLAEARPDPAAVERLAAATLERRERPYTTADLWGNQIGTAARSWMCAVCGATIPWVTSSVAGNGEPYLDAHLKFHNDIERRMRELEGAS